MTGHRDLRPSELTRLRDQVRSILREYRKLYRHSPLRLLCSLASGADLLCALTAMEEGFSLVCALPLPQEDYRKDFGEGDLAQFDSALARAEAVFTVPAAEPVPKEPGRDFWYRQAGIFVAAHCHVLLAIWDGTQGQTHGCGTAETVGFKRHGIGGFQAEAGGAVLHLYAGRMSNHVMSDNSLRLLEDKPGILKKTLCFTDVFNGEKRAAARGFPLVPHEMLERLNPVSRELHSQYLHADTLSCKYRDRFQNAIKGLALAGAIMVLSFLLYDELASSLFLLLYGVLLILSAGFLKFSRHRGYHAKYLQYRVLSESLRIQFFLSAAGIGHNIASSFTWTQKQDSAWVSGALSSLLALPFDSGAASAEMKRYWISEQQSYHVRAAKNVSAKLRVSRKTGGTMAVLTVGFLLATLFLEFLGEPLMTAAIPTDALRPFLMASGGGQVTVSVIIKVLLGAVSAVTLFLSSYYGKMSLERKTADHEKMAVLYRKAGEHCGSASCDEEQLFLRIAQEEIIECGNWYSYCRDNPPSMNL